MTDLKKAAQQALNSLRGYRREIGCKQPCDAERALEAALEQPVQEPLSDEELDRLWREPMSADWEHREFARAIEAAHGIKENITGERRCMKR
jgi:hypothetical protein